ncbi:1-phosphofructokinase family hexose kinase [Moraxella sp. FZFQ2102]|uniref:1-phosphofructokinase family hexose kinase n=1 Tax=Moraxella sp. FZFQ2102 TaxID=2953752 RepID=UPI00209C4FA9|nr:1-phosphofructokinase family hexose kinase [Moraxella sp. FZFQ2102]USZ14856.1 1-phosphofructokinase family hexose kinase [Moraxella sp. FZFQ2102]
MSKSVLCITLNPAIDMTMTVDQLTLGEVNRASRVQVDAAGKALNSAQVLSELGLTCHATGFLGADNDAIFKKLFSQKTARGDILNNNFICVAGETRTNVKLVDDGTTTDVNGKGFIVGASDIQALFDQVGTLAKTCDAVLVAGSLPSGFSLDDFQELLQILTDVNDRIAVDVSGDALKIAINHPLWLIKPNEDELADAFGVQADTLDAQRALFANLNTNIEHIVISMGAHGVNWLHRDQVLVAKPPVMQVQSTVGAGDTLVAGMIFGLLSDADPSAVLRQAVALSAHAVSIVGFGVPNTDELQSLIAQVQIQ